MIGWAGITVWVIGYDLWAILRGRQTLSGAFYEAFRHPTRKWYVLAIWAYLTGHLFGLDKYRWADIRLAMVRKEQRGQKADW